MMARNIFEPVFDTHGNYGLQSKQCKKGLQNGNKPEHKVIMMVWRSPYASTERNEWLERRLRKAYTQYYLKVLVDNMGLFW
ncbi:MAG: hypothetical protein J6A94_10415 [Lachnospiraceae bacterium]|nr:hypothetical protein [Lachnospiraceae bacterium]